MFALEPVMKTELVVNSSPGRKKSSSSPSGELIRAGPQLRSRLGIVRHRSENCDLAAARNLFDIFHRAHLRCAES
ncbi:hypothetical protein sscle_09g068930 [Sclerotinia sclerotiorum 1980 UF-70]|uniref:Uncharacterized protein n=1 Tax=Sclerotinia sclerotiorum (strain ATCC 18683 / 1980 / Ss-1) TaxID=665079 RepID=A0A1D9QBY2_SCLS1|nr:hypothetical protein sscle_09g068930 [Sclerotinia sclerotiorum 1980 UF-70]